MCIELSRDPEPDRESSDYEEYNIVKLEGMNAYEVQFYRGFHQPPPTQEEYQRLIDALGKESDSEESESDE